MNAIEIIFVVQCFCCSSCCCMLSTFMLLLLLQFGDRCCCCFSYCFVDDGVASVVLVTVLLMLFMLLQFCDRCCCCCVSYCFVVDVGAVVSVFIVIFVVAFIVQGPIPRNLNKVFHWIKLPSPHNFFRIYLQDWDFVGEQRYSGLCSRAQVVAHVQKFD